MMFFLSSGILIADSRGLIGTTPYHLVFYSALLLSLAWFLVKANINRLYRTKKLLREKEIALEELELRRSELEMKNKSITDSLVYAQRIQEALLPSENYFKKYFRKSFVLYKPRDIVSGDFYWIGETNRKVFIVAGDCTGHGVPGALMSMIGHDLLEKVIIGENIEKPGDILDRLNVELEKTFRSKRNESMIIRDGMDMGICSIDSKQRKIEFAGSFFPLFVIRENRLLEIKGDKFTLGMAPGGATYNNTEMELREDDMIYLFSDGYVDQFGGDDNKKFMYRRFRYLLMTIHNFNPEDQKSVLEDNMRTWMGSNTQVDDILVIGFKPLE